MKGTGNAPGRATYHNQLDRKLDEAVAAARAFGALTPRIGVVLGSGLGRFVEALRDPLRVPVEQLPNMPRPSVAGHSGALCFGHVADVPVASFQGRVHLYEGHAADEVVFGVRLLARLGCHSVLLTNAAGGIRLDLEAGTLMLIVDHLNLTGHNPLQGFAEPFVDMTYAYDPMLQSAARQAAHQLKLKLREGVYAGVLGPSYETPAEIRAVRALGADAVGMSTVLETIALRQMNVRVGALSCITNVAAGLSANELTHEEVTATALRMEDSFTHLLRRWIELADESKERQS